MSEREQPAGPARDGNTRRYSLEDELAASQLPDHDVHRDAGIYPRELVERAEAERARGEASGQVPPVEGVEIPPENAVVEPGGVNAALAAARQDVARHARPAHEAVEHPAGVHRAVSQSPWEIEAKAHERRRAERTAEYLDTGPAFLRPLRRFALWTRNGIPPEKK